MFFSEPPRGGQEVRGGEEDPEHNGGEKHWSLVKRLEYFKNVNLNLIYISVGAETIS